MKKILFLFLIVLLSSCAASVSSKLSNKSYQKLDDNTPIIVLEKDDTIPTDSQFIGDVKVGDSGFTTDCGYNKAVTEISNSAKMAGANIVQIIEVKKPSVLGSSCYRIKAKIYRNLNPESLATIAKSRDFKNKSRLPDDSDYAVIHFYRPSIAVGTLIGYKIKDANDSIIGRVRNGEKFTYKTKEFGMQSFYGATESKEEIKMNIEKGKEYFVRCSITMGVLVGRPEISQIENYIGMREYEEMK